VVVILTYWQLHIVIYCISGKKLWKKVRVLGRGMEFCKAFVHGIMSNKQAQHPSSSSSSSMDHYPTTRELIPPQSKTLQNWSMDLTIEEHFE
jgi:hypothetical protein